MHREHRSEDLLAHQLEVGRVRLHERGPDEVALRLVALAAHEDLGVRRLSRVIDVAADIVERLLVDNGAHEIGEVADVAHLDPGDLVHQPSLDPFPHPVGDVDPGGGAALLSLVLVAAAHHRRDERILVGARVRHDEVLPAGLAHDPRIRVVTGDVLADGAPKPVEDGGGPGIVDARELRAFQNGLRDRTGVAGNEVDHARGETRRLEHPHQVVAAEHRGSRRLPERDVSHQRGRAREVAGDGGEVERRDRVDEPLERPVLDAIPHSGSGDRLVLVQALGEVHVEPEEIDQLGRGIDFGLVRGLALAQHRGGVDRVAPRRGEQVRRLQDHTGPVFPRPGGPIPISLPRGLDGALGLFLPGHVPGCQHVPMLVRHHRLVRAAGPHLFTPDDQGELDLLALHLGQLRLERLALRGPRSVRPHRLVDRDRDLNISTHSTMLLPPILGSGCLR